ncbi:carbohydrate esterase family 9 protein [Infundibulicybe gibba]|nr:carbohydrate esterase family 9 protein [Infundibulicybe gibba]
MSSKMRIPEARAPVVYGSRMPALVILVSTVATLIVFGFVSPTVIFNPSTNAHKIPPHAQAVLSRCMSLKLQAGPTANFLARKSSDRYEPGTNATWIRNGMLFTGEKNGTVTMRGDLLLDKGIIKSIGIIPNFLLDNTPNLTTIDAKGAWITPGLVDLHSHLGLLSAPLTSGAFDVNSKNGPILPWLRSIDALNTHDEAYALAIAGGVTSVQVLPGSGNAIGGQAFMIKLRQTSERSPSSMIIEPPYSLNTSATGDFLPPRWRHMKQACGENLRKYGNRMDSMWSLRSAYNQARKAMKAQDEYCAKAEAGLWEALDGDFPENLQWEMLIDVLRGRVKVSSRSLWLNSLHDIYRYQTILSNEFKFPIASFHHASEAWLIPEVLKRTYEGTPTIAIFATNHRYKRESFRGSEYAARVLSDADIPVVMKSDHPVINSRYLIHEAQQAHHFSLPRHLALASVTSVPAAAAGLAHRIGRLVEGADADVVLWDSHPLQLGATPVHVWIDGIMQIPVPLTEKDGKVIVGKGKEGDEWKRAPTVPNWDRERADAIKWQGLPPLQGRQASGRVVFRNVRDVWTRRPGGIIEQVFSASSAKGKGDGFTTVIVQNGGIVCMGEAPCNMNNVEIFDTVDLHGGSLSPGLMSYGSRLGTEEIAGEPSTGDGKLLDAFTTSVPRILGDVGGIVRAMDALMFGTRNALTAYRSGVTLATASLASKSFSLGDSGPPIIGGLSTGIPHRPLGGAGVSVSTQLSGLRRLLYGWESTDQETGEWFKNAAEVTVESSPLVIEVHSADIMASLLILKAEVQDKIGSTMRMVFSGAMEAHLIAEDIGRADVGVILNPARPYPSTWEERRILPGPPLTNDTALVKLLQHGVTVGLGVTDAWQARNTRFDLQWVSLYLCACTRLQADQSLGCLGIQWTDDQNQAYALASTNLEKLLGIREIDDDMSDLVAYEGGGCI